MTYAADGAGLFEVSSRGWVPTHFDRWERPRTIAEVEKYESDETSGRMILNEYADLCRRIIIYCYRYYVLSSPGTFDQMFHRLREIEESGTVEVDAASPGQIIYGDQESQYPEWAKS